MIDGLGSILGAVVPNQHFEDKNGKDGRATDTDPGEVPSTVAKTVAKRMDGRRQSRMSKEPQNHRQTLSNMPRRTRVNGLPKGGQAGYGIFSVFGTNWLKKSQCQASQRVRQRSSARSHR